MPEGDTLVRTAAGLRPHLVGRLVERAVSQGPGPTLKVERVVGARIEAVETLGKNLLIRFDNGLEIRTHLRMNGSWHRYRPGERWRRPAARARLVLEVPGAVAVCFDAPVVELFDRRSERVHPALAGLGPDILAADFEPLGAATAVERILAADPDRPISETLLDQRCLAGIGNAWKSEVLFAERIDPFAAIGAFDRDTIARVVRGARELMLVSARGGSTGPAMVYGRGGRPCRRCGTAIATRRHGQLPRVTYWCPTCQVARREESGAGRDRRPASRVPTLAGRDRS